MTIIGSLFAIGAALAFGAVGLLLGWGGWRTLRDEVLPGFVSARPAPADRLATVLLTIGPLAGAALLSLLAAGAFLAVGFGLG